MHEKGGKIMICLRCDHNAIARGLCRKHYHYALKNKEIEIIQQQVSQKGFCSVDGCDNKSHCKKLCKKHYARKLKGKPLKKELDTTRWTELNIVWLAGLLEGEGCFTIHEYKTCNKKYVQTRLHMTDFDIVEKAYNIAGCGVLKGPLLNKKDGRKPTMIWILSEGYPQLELFKRILPYMGKRRSSKIKQCIQILQENLKNVRNPYL